MCGEGKRDGTDERVLGPSVHGEVARTLGFICATVFDDPAAAASPAEAADEATFGIPVGREAVASLLASDVAVALGPVLEIGRPLATLDGHQLGLIIVLRPNDSGEGPGKGEAGKKGGDPDHGDWTSMTCGKICGKRKP